jgi:predicted nucleotidyltransferase
MSTKKEQRQAHAQKTKVDKSLATKDHISTFNTNLDPVPAEIQDELNHVLEWIASVINSQVKMVWLFGSYARGDAINDRRVDPKTGFVSEYRSDVDVLVVVKDGSYIKRRKLWQELNGCIQDDPAITSHIHIVPASLKELSFALRHSEYFYVEVINDGILLVNNGDTTLPKAEVRSIRELRSSSIRYFEDFYLSVTHSQASMELHYQGQQVSPVMYSVHQIMERLFYTYLLVFTYFKPRSHALVDLRERASLVNPEVNAVLPLSSKTEEKDYAILEHAYANARYQLNYSVEPDVVDRLIVLAAKFQAWVLKECLAHIDSLIPEENYSNSHKPIGRIINLERLKTEDIPQAVIARQLKALDLAEWEAKKQREELRKGREAVDALSDDLEKEREEKLNALSERDELLQKLKDAGIDP